MNNCNAVALGIYGHGIGRDYNWVFTEPELSENALAYKQQLINELYTKLGQKPIKQAASLAQLESVLAPHEAKNIYDNLQEIRAACNR